MANRDEGGLSKLFDILAKLAAIIFLLAASFETIVVLVTALFPAAAGTMASIKTFVDQYIPLIMTFGGLVLAGLVALEFGSKNFIFFILILVLLALNIIPRFFNDWWLGILQSIGA